MFNKIELYKYENNDILLCMDSKSYTDDFLIGINEINPYFYRSNKIVFCRNSFVVYDWLYD